VPAKPSPSLVLMVIEMYQTIQIIYFSLIFGVCLGWEGKVVFEDNFDGSSLDLRKWEYQTGCGTGETLNTSTNGHISYIYIYTHYQFILKTSVK